uniref:NADH dehydrogenase subunit 4L n=1 Tax=Plesionika lophotes TaxID=1242014 RepID=UPI0023D7E8D2|nr:NADH dehydrogenase subunit 4L [Plesionika lophotes]WDD39149.1 NADH dehydrogenase subunit 4L [Plesionika lophotes]
MSMQFFFLMGPLFSTVCGVIAFVKVQKHLLGALLSLEYIMLSVFWLMLTVLVQVGVDIYFVLFFLTLAACEGALGLALLVSIVRSHGNDNFSSFSVL